jgi:hypothetical protein
MADAIQNNATELARLLTQEQGKPLADATGEVFGRRGLLPLLRHPRSCRQGWSPMTPRPGSEVRRKPLGVVGCIIPWNFPMILMASSSGRPPGRQHGDREAGPDHAADALRFGELIKDLSRPACSTSSADANDLGGEMTSTRHPQDQLHRLHRDRKEGDGQRPPTP